MHRFRTNGAGESREQVINPGSPGRMSDVCVCVAMLKEYVYCTFAMSLLLCDGRIKTINGRC